MSLVYKKLFHSIGIQKTNTNVRNYALKLAISILNFHIEHAVARPICLCLEVVWNLYFQRERVSLSPNFAQGCGRPWKLEKRGWKIKIHMFWAGFEPAILQFLDRRPRPLIHRSLLEIGIILQFLFTIFHNFLRAQFNLWAQCARMCYWIPLFNKSFR